MSIIKGNMAMRPMSFLRCIVIVLMLIFCMPVHKAEAFSFSKFFNSISQDIELSPVAEKRVHVVASVIQGFACFIKSHISDGAESSVCGQEEVSASSQTSSVVSVPSDIQVDDSTQKISNTIGSIRSGVNKNENSSYQASGITQAELLSSVYGIKKEILDLLPLYIASYLPPAGISQTGVSGASVITPLSTYVSMPYSKTVGGASDRDVREAVQAAVDPIVSSQWTSENSVLYYKNGGVSIGTTTSPGTLSVDGSIYLANTSAPVLTANQLYVQNGDLYYGGNLIGGATTGNWASNGSDVWRASGKVGIGTVSPRSELEVNGSLIVASSTSLNIYNPEFGYGVNNVSAIGGGYHTILNGSLQGLNGGTAQVIIGGRVVADTNGSNFNTVIGPGAVTAITGSSGASSVFGYGANLTNTNRSTALGYGATLPSGAIDAIAIGNGNAKVVVGGSLSTTARLHIRGLGSTSATNALFVENSSGTSLMMVADSGNVGIGTTTPSMKLSISGGGIRIGTNVGDDFGFQIIRDANGAYGAVNSLVFRAEQAGGAGYSFQTSNGTSLMHITNAGNVGISTSTPTEKLSVVGNGYFTGSVQVNAVNAAGSATNLHVKFDTDLANGHTGLWYDTNSNGNLGIAANSTEMIRVWGSHGTYTNGKIYMNGNVGIGTTNPLHKLTIGAGAQTIAFEGVAGVPYVGIGYDTSVGSGGQGGIVFRTNVGSTNLNGTVMTIARDTGNVGIGTTTPGNKLVVTGAAQSNMSFLSTMGYSDTSAGGLQLSGYFGTLWGLYVNNSGNLSIGYGNTGAAKVAVTTSGVITGLAANIGVNENNTGVPTYSFTTDSNTGMYKPSSDNLGLVTGGTERLRIDSSGNIGIGATTVSAKLQVGSDSLGFNGAASILIASNSGGLAIPHTATYFDYYGNGSNFIGGDTSFRDTGGTTYRMVVNGTGVGIGTTTPSQKLVVVGNSYVTGASTANSFSLVEGGGMNRDGNQATVYGSYVLNLRPNLSTPGWVIDNVGSLTPLVGNDNTLDIGNVSNRPRNIHIGSNGYFGGSVGIGTTTPGSKLDVFQNTVGSTGISDVQARATIFERNHASLGLAFAHDNVANRPLIQSVSNGVAFPILLNPYGGNVGIGTTTPSQKLTVAGTIQSTDLLGGATTLSTDANGNIIRTPSDQKLKTNIETLTSSLDKVRQLRGVSYKWIDEAKFGSSTEIGLIAQEVQTVVPEVVKGGGSYLSVNYQNLVALLIEAIKELANKVEQIAGWFTDGKFTIKDDVCVDDVCVTKDEFKQMLINSKQGSSGQTVNNTTNNTTNNTGNNNASSDDNQGNYSIDDSSDNSDDVDSEDNSGVTDNSDASENTGSSDNSDISEDVGITSGAGAVGGADSVKGSDTSYDTNSTDEDSESESSTDTTQTSESSESTE